MLGLNANSRSIGVRTFGLTTALCCVLHSVAASGAPALKAFPTAEGFGANAVGGRGGRVIEVINLDDSGPGSLRAAMEASGPRICVFRVSGTIALKTAIRVKTPFLTVAGQTSPGGIQIRGSGEPEGDWGVWFVNGAHDIVVRLRLPSIPTMTACPMNGRRSIASTLKIQSTENQSQRPATRTSKII